eukprot:jgi/Galph1/3284/GphlegSOOS_G1953.1
MTDTPKKDEWENKSMRDCHQLAWTVFTYFCNQRTRKTSKSVSKKLCLYATCISHEFLSQQRKFIDSIWTSYIHSGDTCVDATCGKGRDTVRLAELVGPNGFVLACDVQPCAIETTQALIESILEVSQRPMIKYVCHSHEDIARYLEDGSVRVINYNLGYLPGSDRSITTSASSTRNSLEQLLPKVQYGGLVSLMSYIGHDGGLEERNEMLAYLSQLSSQEWCLTHHQWLNRRLAPSIILLERLLDKYHKKNIRNA